MSGQFTRLTYDSDAYDEKLLRSLEPLLYKLDPAPYVNCNQSLGARNGHDASLASGNMTDVDSILKGITQTSSKASKCPAPLSYQTYDLPQGNNFLETEYSRFICPARDIKGLTTRDHNFGYPLTDPQCNIFESTAMNTKLYAKDNHVPSCTKPMNQSNLLPPQRPDRCRRF